MSESDHTDPTPHKRCLDCGYILDGLPENRCPECRRSFDPQDPTTYIYTHQYRTGRLYLVVAIVGATVFAVGALTIELKRRGYVSSGSSVAVLSVFAAFGLMVCGIVGPLSIRALRGSSEQIADRRTFWAALLISGVVLIYWLLMLAAKDLVSLGRWLTGQP